MLQRAAPENRSAEENTFYVLYFLSDLHFWDLCDDLSDLYLCDLVTLNWADKEVKVVKVVTVNAIVEKIGLDLVWKRFVRWNRHDT